MILYRFEGGLGNQMFQYATFYSLQRHYQNSNIVADISKILLTGSEPRTQIEMVYNVRLPYWVPGSIRYSIADKYVKKTINSALNIYSKIGNLRFIKDDNHFNHQLFDLKETNNYLIQGYWADQRYFKMYADELRKIFYPKNPASSANENLLKRIKDTDSVSVHIRRGDYLKTGSFLDVNTFNYYEHAFQKVMEEHPDASFFIFSDDIKWSRQRFGNIAADMEFVDHNIGMDAYWDIFLMSQCNTNIIANSTFSWWAGWLNENQGKKVYCPSKIFISKKRNELVVPQFYPEEWVKI